jgi:peptide/nickel transport system permease protein
LPPPSLEHPFGTDNFGRDVFSRIIYGARTALAIGFLSSLARLHHRRADRRRLGLFRRLDRQHHPALHGRDHVVPDHRPGAAVVAVLGKNIPVGGLDFNLIIAIGLPMIPKVARVVRSSALAIREMPYIDAARACGYGHSRIVCATSCRTSWRPT